MSTRQRDRLSDAIESRQPASSIQPKQDYVLRGLFGIRLQKDGGVPLRHSREFRSAKGKAVALRLETLTEQIIAESDWLGDLLSNRALQISYRFTAKGLAAGDQSLDCELRRLLLQVKNSVVISRTIRAAAGDSIGSEAYGFQFEACLARPEDRLEELDQQYLRLRDEMREAIQLFLMDLSGQEFPTLAEKQMIATRLRELMKRVELRVKCPECGEPGILKAASAGRSGARGLFQIACTSGTTHGAYSAFPSDLNLIDAPPDKRLKRVPT